MAIIIKSYTDLSQSKKLAEILPLESADMRIGNYVGKSGKVDGTNIHYYPKGESFGAPEIIDAWSLAALLSVLPEGFSFVLTKSFNGEDYYCKLDGEPIETTASNPVDACVAMVEKLHELKIL
jgi:hypothetical protein